MHRNGHSSNPASGTRDSPAKVFDGHSKVVADKTVGNPKEMDSLHL